MEVKNNKVKNNKILFNSRNWLKNVLLWYLSYINIFVYIIFIIQIKKYPIILAICKFFNKYVNILKFVLIFNSNFFLRTIYTEDKDTVSISRNYTSIELRYAVTFPLTRQYDIYSRRGRCIRKSAYCALRAIQWVAKRNVALRSYCRPLPR